MSSEKQTAVDFLKWCNEPIYRHRGELSREKRATPQYPDYDCFLVIDETGMRILGDGVFPNESELYDYWKSTLK